jgi:hypothetical protein
MNSADNSAFAQPFRIGYSRILFRLEIALQLLVLICIVQIIDWPYVVLFVLLFLLLGWQFFNNHSISRQYGNDCQILILNNPAGIHWVGPEGECIYPQHEIKILMNRWFILLQLGKRHRKIRRVLLADSFESLELYSLIRQRLLRLNYAS